MRQTLLDVSSIARQAGALALEHFGRVTRLSKTHATTANEAVTIADRLCQQYIVAELRARWPQDGIIGEESESGDGITCQCPRPDGRVWVIDPIDGTNNFIAGFHQFAICIGLLEAGMPVLGVVYEPANNRWYAAAAGCGATLNDRPITAAATPLSDQSLLMLTSNLLYRDGRFPAWAGRWMSQTTWKVRALGSAALEAVQVGAGIAHGAVTVNGKLWDAVAAAAIVLEAGGTVLTLEGLNRFPMNIAGYCGEKVPFLAAAPLAARQLSEEMLAHP